MLLLWGTTISCAPSVLLLNTKKTKSVTYSLPFHSNTPTISMDTSPEFFSNTLPSLQRCLSSYYTLPILTDWSCTLCLCVPFQSAKQESTSYACHVCRFFSFLFFFFISQTYSHELSPTFQLFYITRQLLTMSVVA